MIHFSHPLFLWLFFLTPFIFYIYKKRSSALTLLRRRISLILRLAIFTFLILSLAGIKVSLPGRGKNVFFLLDVSESITEEQRVLAFNYLKRIPEMMKRKDQAGLILFGKEAFVEFLPRKDFRISSLHTFVDSLYTNISGALMLASKNFPQQGNKEIVLLSDGNENRGEARNLVNYLKENKIKVNVFPLTGREKKEALLKEMILPSQVKKREKFEIRIIAQSFFETEGILKLYVNDKFLEERKIKLEPEEKLFSFEEKLEKGGFYTYKAILEVWPDNIPSNNQIYGYTLVKGGPKILLITREREAIGNLIEVFKKNNFSLEICSPFNAPSSLDELSNYSAIILNNISALWLSSLHLKRISEYVKDLGGGLVVIGGENSFGPGGYRDTPLEEALPVYAGIRQKTSLPYLSMVLIIDKSGSMSGGGNEDSLTKISLAKKAAGTVVDLLPSYERIGILSFDTDCYWTVPLQLVANKPGIIRELSSLKANGGTSLYPALKEAFEELRKEKSTIKHIIVLSDGLSTEDNFEEIVKKMKEEKVTVSTVAIGEDADIELMRNIALWGKGKAYYTSDIQSIPRIFTTETLRVTRSLVVKESFLPIINAEGPLTSGINWQNVPPLEGYTVTTPKQISTIYLLSPRKDPLLVSWRYGLGRAVVFTSDYGKWSKNWKKWQDYDKFWIQLVRWVIPTTQSFLFPTVSIEEEKGHLTVDALDEKGKYLNFLSLKARIIKTESKIELIFLEQTAPGRYEGWFSTDEVGSYIISIFNEEERGLKQTELTGAVVSYSPEYKDLTPNKNLLTYLSENTEGKVLSFSDNPFKERKFTFSSPYGLQLPLLALAIFLFLLDVGIRVVPPGTGALLFKKLISIIK